MDYKKMSLPELKEAVKERNIKGTSTLRKPELIEILEKYDAEHAPKEKAVKVSKKTVVKKSEAVKDKSEDKKEKSEIINDKTEIINDKTKTPRIKTVKPAEKAEMPAPKAEKASEAAPVPAPRVSRVQRIVKADQRPQSAQNQYYPNRQNQYQQSNYQNQYQQNQNQQGYQRPTYQQQNQYQQNQYQSQYQYQQGYQRPTYQQQNQYQQNNYQPQRQYAQAPAPAPAAEEPLDTGIIREGVLEVLKTEGYGFIRCDNYLPGEEDVYVSPTQIRRYNLKTGDMIKGSLKRKNPQEKFQGMCTIESINGVAPEIAVKRPRFEDLTPEFPHERIHLETQGASTAMRIVDLISPIGKGQRGMIVSQPKAGKTTLLKQIANAITQNHPDMYLFILLIDERPEEVTDIKENIKGDKVEVIYSTFDELPENHKRVSEMVIERCKRLVEHGKDVCILLDSITRLARAYNLTCENSGRTLSGGLDPAALHMPKKFFGAARCMREGGSLTILATALVDTGSRMDDVVFEEFKGTGNMELVLDRSLSERRIFPAIDLPKSGTRREDLLLEDEELRAAFLMRTALNGAKSEEAIEIILNMLKSTKSNQEMIGYILKHGIFNKTVQ